ncbi:hypothetical protein ACFWP5_40640 [Streptomyces sp. NPDC058469]|uniref:hypothetical protein n=1 Tax=Streptomyces sp. NPDC058469 TaxID=3346514 RepID=UPI00364EC940
MTEPHISIGYHDEHGFVAHPALPPHLADWMLSRVQFEKVPDSPLYRLAHRHQDPLRRTRQAVKDLRAIGITVHADNAQLTAAPAPEQQVTP